MTETVLLDTSELFHFDRSLIDDVAFPVGDRYPGEIFTNYFAWYGGLAHKYKPGRILEIGVRYGYTGIVFCLGAKSGRNRARVEYIGLDDESYHYGSCQRANENFAKVIPSSDAKAIQHNTFNGIPSQFGTFDLIHIDGNHDFHGVMNDLQNCWPILNPGGIIALDDTYFPCIREAIETFMAHLDAADVEFSYQWVENERGHCYIRKADL